VDLQALVAIVVVHVQQDAPVVDSDLGRRLEAGEPPGEAAGRLAGQQDGTSRADTSGGWPRSPSCGVEHVGVLLERRAAAPDRLGPHQGQSAGWTKNAATFGEGPQAGEERGVACPACSPRS
jgi:hypothetical protein